jgi:hypothetical protein
MPKVLIDNREHEQRSPMAYVKGEEVSSLEAVELAEVFDSGAIVLRMCKGNPLNIRSIPEDRLRSRRIILIKQNAES